MNTNTSFCIVWYINRYARFFDFTLRQLPKAVNSDEEDIVVDSRPTALWISSLYHMITSMDRVYEQVTEYHELLRPTLRMVLPR